MPGVRSLLHAFAVLLALTATAAAQDYPSKSVRLIIPFAPGGSVDIVARLVAAKLGERLGQQVVPDNRPGAGGIIATDLAIKAPADGHTLLLVSLAHAVNPWVYKPPYDTKKSLTFVASLGNGASVLTTHPSVPANSVRELIALAKSKPKSMHFAHAGVGSFTHTASVLFAMMAGIDVMQVPFRGGGPAMIDVMGGHSQLLMNSYVASLPHIRSGKLKPLGVSDTRRSALLPDVPTIAEAGVPGYQAANWWGIAAPIGTPQAIVDKLNREINAALDSDDVKKKFDSDGAVIVRMTPAEFAKFYDVELEKWGKVVKEADIKRE
ncbi:MAG: tripartite tricarboxylate transporter substrate binding protein [Alphaproteobacteria bacterium]|nr:tripartite tricarboxylate transporter substrate binding protein [Alphaproteobacteria bacterium]